MATQWAKHEAKTNELAALVDRLLLWLKVHQQTAIWTGLGIVAALAVGGLSINRYLANRDAAWAKLAIAQSYAYSGQPASAVEQLKTLAEESPSSPASGYGLLLAGDIFFQQDKFKEAEESYQKALDSSSAKDLPPIAHAGLALSQEGEGDCTRAAETGNRFLESYQDHFLAPQVHASLARCFLAMGQPDKAKSAYERMAFL